MCVWEGGGAAVLPFHSTLAGAEGRKDCTGCASMQAVAWPLHLRMLHPHKLLTRTSQVSCNQWCTQSAIAHMHMHPQPPRNSLHSTHTHTRTCSHTHTRTRVAHAPAQQLLPHHLQQQLQLLHAVAHTPRRPRPLLLLPHRDEAVAAPPLTAPPAVAAPLLLQPL